MAFSTTDRYHVALRMDEAARHLILAIPAGNRSTVFGPYLTLAPGHYRAAFDIGLSARATGTVAVIDVTGQYGRKTYAEKDVDVASAGLVAGGHAEVSLEFDLPEPTDRIEFRTHAVGAAITMRGVTLIATGRP